MNLEERHWENLLADIQGRQVIPVIGPELLIIEIEGKPITLPGLAIGRAARTKYDGSSRGLRILSGGQRVSCPTADPPELL